MSISGLFTRLGAPLANPRWSWGGVRDDGTVVLRVWADEIQNRQALVFNKHMADSYASLGIAERLRHIDLIREGASVWLVVCHAVDPAVTPREIRTFNDRSVFIGGELIDTPDMIAVEIADRKEV